MNNLPQPEATPEFAESSHDFGDPSLINRLAWKERWGPRAASSSRARFALSLAKAARGQRSKQEEGLAHRTLGWLAKWSGDFDRAHRDCLRAEALLTEREHPSARADIYSILGVIHYSRNRYDLARNCVERGLHILRPEDPVDSMIDLLTTKATVQRYCGLPAKSAATLNLARSLAKGRELARVDHNISRGLLAEGEYAQALECAERAVALAAETRNRVIEPYAHEVAGAALNAMGRDDEAADHFDRGLAIAVEDKDARAQCQIIRYHADIERKRGNLERARDLYRHGLWLCEDLAYHLFQKTFLLSLAEVNEALGDLKDALENHKAAWRLEENRRS